MSERYRVPCSVIDKDAFTYLSTTGHWKKGKKVMPEIQVPFLLVFSNKLVIPLSGFSLNKITEVCEEEGISDTLSKNSKSPGQAEKERLYRSLPLMRWDAMSHMSVLHSLKSTCYLYRS